MGTKYSDQEFARILGEKVSNIQTFRAELKRRNYLRDRERLDENFIKIFKAIQKRREENKETWTEACKYELNTLSPEPEDRLFKENNKYVFSKTAIESYTITQDEIIITLKAE